MENKELYCTPNLQNPPVPPPSYNVAMGLNPIPPQPIYQVPPQIQSPIITPQPIIINQPVGPNPSSLICPQCRSHIITRVEHEPGTNTHLLALFLCLFGCWCCTCLPYCVDDCKNSNHYCPNCGTFLGSYNS